MRLVPPTDPDFDSIARPLIGERVADTVLTLKPMLVIVANDSTRRVQAAWIVVHGYSDPYDDQFLDQFVDRKAELLDDAVQTVILNCGTCFPRT